jgi:hypothetical protein
MCSTYHREMLTLHRFRNLAAPLLWGSALAIGCIGSVDSDCPSGGTCLCEGIGSCTYDCDDGNCALGCEGTGNCFLNCPGGDCVVDCRGQGNCNVTCAGGGCHVTCSGTGNCELSQCDDSCSLDCQTIGTCSQV